MQDNLLEIHSLDASAGEKEILHHIDLTIKEGETHVIMGPNGAGKSSLAAVLTGNPGFTVTNGSVKLRGEELTGLPVNERAKRGIFLSFQNPVEIPGISLENFMRAALESRTGEKIRAWTFRKEVKKALGVLRMDPAYAERDLNVGFSGGEKKKAEILQMLLLRPSLAILDETDSGLDVDAVRTVSRGIREFQKDKSASLLVITHNAAILSSLEADRVHILVNGRFAASGGRELIDTVAQKGFSEFEENAE